MNHFLIPLILAAGASSRMGRPKALLDLGGRTALDRILDTCALAGLGPPIVVLGCGAEAVEAGADVKRATVVRNAEWERGMTSSVQAGLKGLPKFAEGVFVWPVDLPLVPAQVPREMGLRFWILRQSRREPIVIPVGARRGHPVLFDRRYIPELAALAAGEAPRVVVERHADAVDEVRAGDEVVLDLDTPEDYERAKKGLR